MIGKGQIAQKRPYWGENKLKSKIKGKYKYPAVFWRLSGTDATASGKLFQCFTTRHANLFLLLWVLPVCWRSLSADLLSPGLLENLSSWDASRSTWLYMTLWTRTKSFRILLFSRDCTLRSLSLSSQLKFLSPLTHLVAARCILSRWYASLLRYGEFAWMAYYQPPPPYWLSTLRRVHNYSSPQPSRWTRTGYPMFDSRWDIIAPTIPPPHAFILCSTDYNSAKSA